jgi:hypothetical protein
MNQIQIVPPAIIEGAGFDYTKLDDPALVAEAQATAGRIRDRLRTSYINTGNDLIRSRISWAMAVSAPGLSSSASCRRAAPKNA